MVILPAIDIKGGRCVRLQQGRADKEKVYFDKPAEVAREWKRQGAKWIHVVDLDGAFEGDTKNLSVLEAICSAVDIPIEFGGGNRNMEVLDRVFGVGVERAVLGTAALKSPDFLAEACDKFGEKIAVGIDARDGKVAIKGWVDVTEIDAIEFARRVADAGAGLVIYTDISRDGMMVGPNKAALKKMAESVSIPIIASGGISTLEDVAEISKLAPGRITGMIIGKALYENSFTLESALEVVEANVSRDK